MQSIFRSDFPALNQLLWDTKLESLSPEFAFLMYEKRWRYIDQKQLRVKERMLIEQLIQHVGKGLFLPAQ